MPAHTLGRSYSLVSSISSDAGSTASVKLQSCIRFRNTRTKLTTDTYPPDSVVIFQLPCEPAIYHRVVIDDENGNLKMLTGHVNGKGDKFVQALKQTTATFKWEEAEWVNNDAVAKGAGIPGKSGLIT